MPDKNKAAYTLSEIILAIGIIGIIAALTIPQLVQNAQNKELVSAFLKSNNVLANAYKEAKAVDNIQKMGVEDFKSTFKKHLKTVECEEHEICLQDGMFVDFTCGEEKCTELTVDTNGDKKPNKKGKDWFKFYITQDRIIPQGEQEQCSGYDCGMYTLTYHKIFDGLIDNCKTYKAGQCETCDDGYHLSSNKCSAIKFPTCDTFSGEECTACKTGYLLQDKDCINMDSLNCATTEDGKTCSTCKPTHILNSTSNICESLDDVQCQTKAEDESCLQCKTTFQNNEGVCETGAITNCQTYSGLTCTTCSNTTLLTNGTCQTLSAVGCQTKSTTAEQCAACNSSNILSDGRCSALSTYHCKTKSTTAENCSQCLDTFQNRNGVCETGQIANCRVYSGLTCNTCANGYYKKTNGKCQINYCVSQNGSTCVLNNNLSVQMYDMGTYYYVANTSPKRQHTLVTTSPDPINVYNNALQYCRARNMELPTVDEVKAIRQNAYSRNNGVGFCIWATDGNAYNFHSPSLFSTNNCWAEDYYVICVGRK